MEKIIPYGKLSKKERRKLDQSRRQTWGDLNPVTRKPTSSKAYSRNKARNWKRDYHEPIPGVCFLSKRLNLWQSFSALRLFQSLLAQKTFSTETVISN